MARVEFDNAHEVLSVGPSTVTTQYMITTVIVILVVAVLVLN